MWGAAEGRPRSKRTPVVVISRHLALLVGVCVDMLRQHFS